ncbi:MAG: glutamyl-tRNA reductase [Bacteroidota bacterium]|nr:glutamyl-tRNA reductase [Bacteroidota bacterium]
MQNIHIIAITHRHFDSAEIGRFHLSDERRSEVLHHVKSFCGLTEFMYLSTCNRVEFLFIAKETIDAKFISTFFNAFFGPEDQKVIETATTRAEIFSGVEALRHIFRVAASLDSMVVGEREIITQVRKAYDESRVMGIAGDTIRILVQKTIETAKEVYTQTDIARNPVSVVSLAYRKLRALNVPLNARILFVGAGVTNTAMARYLSKHGFTDFAVFNRTLTNAEKLAAELKGNAFQLDSLQHYSKGFDVIVTCTGAENVVITKDIYQSLTGEDMARKVVIDLAVPNDLDPAVPQQWDVNLIAVNNLQEIAKDNLNQRENQLEACRVIIENSILEFRGDLRQRQVEIAMSDVPRKVKEIRDTAVNAVFAKEISQLDSASKEVLEKILSYVEKKYISVPMKMAREILEEEVRQN